MNEVGYHRVNLSMMLGGASWAFFAARELATRPRVRLLLLVCSGTVLLGQSLTGGRTGYGTWALVGLVLCLARWRAYLLPAPLVVALIVAVVPGVKERMLQGFAKQDPLVQEGIDEYEVTAGRTLIWPYVIAKIKERPILGYGGLAMERTGLQRFLMQELKESFPHPHNMYLEMLLDNGLIGAVLVLPFYLVTLAHAMTLFLESRSRVAIAIGGSCLALMLSLLVAGFGSQTFYPREGSVGMWCCFGLMMRVAVERARVLAGRSRQPARSVGFDPARQTPSAPVSGWSGRRPGDAASLDDQLWAAAP
jgi:O-antigen ligase